ncbi:hypothetical protein ABQF13_24725 [Mycolicibacterium sp. XJ879]
MTVVLALRCADGLVMGSVSQITDPGRGLSYPAQKLHMMGKRAAWAAAVPVLDALDVSSPSVGGPMDLCRITPDGSRHLDPDEVEGVRAQVDRWLRLEKSALDGLFE